MRISRKLRAPLGIDIPLTLDVGDGGEHLLLGVEAVEANQSLVGVELTSVERRAIDTLGEIFDEFLVVNALRTLTRHQESIAQGQRQGWRGYGKASKEAHPPPDAEFNH